MSGAAIAAWVVADDDLEGLIATRIYPVVLPANPTLPAVTYQLVSEPTEPTQDGPGLARPRYRFRIWAETYIELGPIATALKAAFANRRDGPFQVSTVDTSLEDRDLKTGRWWRIVDVLGWQPA